MITEFDLGLLFFVACAALLSSNPKREAILFCFVCAFGGVYADYLLTGIVQAYVAIMIEISAVFVLTYFGKRQDYQYDKWFFFAMAGFMGLSAAITMSYAIGINGSYLIEKPRYLYWSHAIAVGHVFFMLVLSDGIKRFIRNWISPMFDGRLDLFDNRD